MIQIEAFNINTGGAKNLLLYFIKYYTDRYPSEINVSTKDSFIKEYLNQFRTASAIKSDYFSILRRFLSSEKNVFYFGNLPPLRSKENSVLYIHNEYYTLGKKELSNLGLTQISIWKYFLLRFYLKIFHRNVKYIACQTDFMKSRLELMLNREILKVPFFEEFNLIDVEKQFDFCYVGLPSKHKNHERLFLALIDLVKRGKKFSCAVTVPLYESNHFLIEFINQINNSGISKIINFGICSPTKVQEIYSQSKALIFPSLAESFGLPIIEALQQNLKVLSSDLPFTYELIENPITFNPLDKDDISLHIENLLDNKYQNIFQKLKVVNNIDILISLLNPEL